MVALEALSLVYNGTPGWTAVPVDLEKSAFRSVAGALSSANAGNWRRLVVANGTESQRLPPSLRITPFCARVFAGIERRSA